MKLSTVAAGSAIAGRTAAHPTALSIANSTYPSVDYNTAPPNISTLANNSLFETWRPKSHVLPPQNQIGDPCMHYTDPETGIFHVGWLYNGNGASGATTEDLVTYQDLNPDGAQMILPGGVNDPIAVFDGAVIPSGIDGKPTMMYTSVSYMPISWSIAYTRGSETQSLAVSSDGGRNFTKLEQGPAIPSPPFAANVTSWRDPFLFQNHQFDSLLESKNGTWYNVISGGIHGDGPSAFLYRQQDPDFQYWEYLGEWWHEEGNSTWGSGDWAGRWGYNFEVINIFGLDEEGYNLNGEVFATVGTEWSFDPIKPQASDNREMLWAAGNVTLEDGDIKFTPSMAGYLDWGLSAYAAAGKELPASSKASQNSGAPDRFVTYLWLTGDYFEGHDFPTAQQNWTGSLLLPRELSVGTIPNVVDNELSREMASWRVGTNDTGVLELVTLKQEIAREPLAEMTSGNSFIEPSKNISSPGTTAFKQSPDSKFFVLTASLSFPSSARNADLKAGFELLSSEFESTTIYYQFSNESIIIDRSNSSAAARTTNGIDTRNEFGRMRLFDVVEDGHERIETLDLTIVIDNSIVEVHANGRFALSTWVR